MIVAIIIQWVLGLLSIVSLGGSILLWYEWCRRSWIWDPMRHDSFFHPAFGSDGSTLIFAAASALTLFAVAGLPMVKGARKLVRRDAKGGEDPRVAPIPSSSCRIRRPDGSELYVEFHGPANRPVIVATHGWGLSSKEWNPLVRDLALDFRLVLWDLAGLGQSTQPANRDFSIEKLAGDLKAVVECAGGKPAVLMGHSIGGMTTLTFCRLFPEALGDLVGGLILTHTTPMNPVRTTRGAAFLTAIEKGGLRPLMHVTIALSPLLRMMNFLTYWNGTAHLTSKFAGFGGTETWEQIDFAARFQLHASPAVFARGVLGMMGYNAMETLSSIKIPVLVVAGDLDSITKPLASELIHESIPGAELKVLAPARHLGLIEHHREYAREVKGFVNRACSLATSVGA